MANTTPVAKARAMTRVGVTLSRHLVTSREPWVVPSNRASRASRSHSLAFLWPRFPLAVLSCGLASPWPRFPLAALSCGLAFLWPRFPVASLPRGLAFLWPRFPVASLSCGLASPWPRFPLAALSCGLASPWPRFPLASLSSGALSCGRAFLWPCSFPLEDEADESFPTRDRFAAGTINEIRTRTRYRETIRRARRSLLTNSASI